MTEEERDTLVGRVIREFRAADFERKAVYVKVVRYVDSLCELGANLRAIADVRLGDPNDDPRVERVDVHHGRRVGGASHELNPSSCAAVLDANVFNELLAEVAAASEKFARLSQQKTELEL